MISVCLTTCNGGRFIAAQLHSVLSQLSGHDEVIIADDGSRDDTLAITRGIADPRIRYLPASNGLGVVRNFERTLAAARGDLVFLCDQDDVWLPGKVDLCVAALRENLLVVTDCRVVDSELGEIFPSFFAVRHSGPGILHNLFRNSYLGCCMAFRRELLATALPIPGNVPMHDMWLGLLAECRGKVHFLPDTLLLYRRHGHNLSPTASPSPFSLYRKLRYRIVLIWLLCLRVYLKR